MPRLKLALVAVLTVLVAGCQLRTAVDVAVSADGSGTVELLIGLDEELLGLLSDAGFDPEIGLAEALASAPGWEVEQLEVEDGLTFAFRSSFEDPREFERMMRNFGSGGQAGDAELFDGLVLDVAEDGAVTFRGQAGLLLPNTTGAEGMGVSFDADDLAALLEERGDEFVRYDLRVTLPAEPVEHDADLREGNSLVWHLPVGEMRAVGARSAAPPNRGLWVALAVGALAAVLGLVGARWWRRRRRRRAPRA